MEAAAEIRATSKKAGLSMDAITKTECGHMRSQPRTVRKLADTLGVGVEYLTGAPQAMASR